MFNYRQSSEDFEFIAFVVNSVWIHVARNSVAFLIPVHGSTDFGVLNRICPTGAVAYGTHQN